MSGGFIELIIILLSLGGFGIEANPRAPSAAEIMRYAPADADYAVHVDIRALVPGNYQALAGMAGGPALREAPDAQAMIQDVMRELEAFRGMARGLMGVDPVTDIDSASVWIRLPADGLPAVLAVIRGTIGDDIVSRIASLTGAEVIEVHGRKALLAPDGVAMLAVKDGNLLVGTPAWVEVRLTEGWKPVRPRGAAARAAALLENAPFFVAVSSPSREAVERAGRAVGAGGNVAADMVTGHGFAGVALYHDGVAWEVTSRSKQGHERMVMASEGLLDLLRAGHHGSRGAARVLLASLASYAGTDEAIDLILRRQQELLAVIDRMTGPGSFRASVDARAGQRTLVVRARGSKLTDVVPVAGFAPLAGLVLYFTEARRETGGPAPVAADEPGGGGEPGSEARGDIDRETPGALQVGDVYRGVKRRVAPAHGVR